MPVFDVGFRDWRGERERPWKRFWVIASTGIRLAWKNQWLRRMLFLAWLPAFYFGAMFFFFERAMEEGVAENAARMVIGRFPDARSTAAQVLRDGPPDRQRVWSYLLMTLFRYPQGILMVMLVGLIAPPLISRDLRTRSHLLYFARPLGLTEYIFGKAFVVGVYLLLVSTLPALTLYILGVMLSPNISVVYDTWDLPLRIAAASMIVIVPTTAIALCFSSLTEETRYASFGWFAMWVVGWVAYTNLTVMDAGRFRRSAFDAPSRWTFVSLYHTLGEVQTWVFGFDVESDRLRNGAIILGVATVLSICVIFRRMWLLQRK